MSRRTREEENGSSSIRGSTSRPIGLPGGTRRRRFSTTSIFSADYIYITHWHFDHFDPRTLKKFSKHTTVMVPKFPISGLPDQLRNVGFERIIELEHGKTIRLADGFDLTSYQITFQDDSAAVIQADGVTLIDLNDSKPLPSTWKTFRAKYPKMDFMLRSHSPAWSYPTRYTFEDPSDRLPVDATTYMEAFVAAAAAAATAVRRAVCQRHLPSAREVRDENRYLVSAPEMKAYFEAQSARVPDATLAIMPVGSRLVIGNGFRAYRRRRYRHGRVTPKSGRAGVSERLEKTYRSEAEKQVSFDDFSAYFAKFFKSTWWLRPFLRHIRWVFPVQSPQQQFWTVDFGSATMTRSAGMPAEYDSLITVAPAVLSASLRNNVFTNVDISKRWRVHVRRGSAMRHFIVTNLLLLHEAEYLSPKHLLSWRFISGYFRRLPEVDRLCAPGVCDGDARKRLARKGGHQHCGRVRERGA